MTKCGMFNRYLLNNYTNVSLIAGYQECLFLFSHAYHCFNMFKSCVIKSLKALNHTRSYGFTDA